MCVALEPLTHMGQWGMGIDCQLCLISICSQKKIQRMSTRSFFEKNFPHSPIISQITLPFAHLTLLLEVTQQPLYSLRLA